jgi:hypothetical protein
MFADRWLEDVIVCNERSSRKKHEIKRGICFVVSRFSRHIDLTLGCSFALRNARYFFSRISSKNLTARGSFD